MQKFKERRDLRYIYQNELDIACCQHDMAYGDFKDSTRRTASDNRTMMDIKGVLLQWFILVFLKKTSFTRENKFSGSGIKNENMSDQHPSDLATRK